MGDDDELIVGNYGGGIGDGGGGIGGGGGDKLLNQLAMVELQRLSLGNQIYMHNVYHGLLSLYFYHSSI